MPRYAMPEGLFADLHIQPHVHDLSVLITRRSIQTKFRVYFRRHCRLPRNATRQGIRGEVLFMRAGKQCKDAVVGLRAGDPLLITSILKQCVRSFLSGVCPLNRCSRIVQDIINFQVNNRKLPSLIELQYQA
ncbi:unnamed protein product [Mycena citricolor]|uniref:Uncharacterized protein n=1 Tax=Mycena citricolor TaxID=2018698 RepID=A0AAD2Q1P5_9AGAR|nr:unnamed protein product [Mycena citricolor]CAK5277483.1 unnamed protein product [Mycena citricolor]